MQKASKIILGIDPGTIIMGYGLIEIKGTTMRLLEMNVLKLSSKNDAYEKLEKSFNTFISSKCMVVPLISINP